MQHMPVAERIRSARANIRLATQICGAADLVRLQHAIDILEATTVEMRLAEDAVRSGMVNEVDELRRETALMKSEIAGMMRVIDGCAALHRGLSVRLGCTASAYTPQGRAVAAAPSSTATEMQG